MAIHTDTASRHKLEEKGLRFTFSNDKRVDEEHTIHFYERNSMGRGLEFDDHPEAKSYFVRFAVKLRCLNPIVDTKKNPLPPLEELAEAVYTLLTIGLKPNKEPRRELGKILQPEGAVKTWFPTQNGPCSWGLRINTHLGAGAVMTPGKIQDRREQQLW